MNDSIETITLAGGCFWCVEAVFELVEGVVSVISGYTGGHTENPSYMEVCSGTSGHAESIQVKFDSNIIDYPTVLEIFFAYHDPTTLDRQGPDIGSHYRSEIFYHTNKQKEIAEIIIKGLESEEIFPAPIVTKISEMSTFYEAESYHQSFYKKNGYQPYCQILITPKVAKLREMHSELLKPEPHSDHINEF
jgi:peptide-methionine (S)-S-oxide reductase